MGCADRPSKGRPARLLSYPHNDLRAAALGQAGSIELMREILASLTEGGTIVRTRLNGGSWVKSSRSSGGNGCVEGRLVPAGVAVRDSKLGEASPVLEFSSTAWVALVAQVKAGRLDC
jgi:hypothetical protein